MGVPRPTSKDGASAVSNSIQHRGRLLEKWLVGGQKQKKKNFFLILKKN